MAQISWTGAIAGTSDWDSIANWTQSGTTTQDFPGAADDVVFIKAGIYSVQILASDPAYTVHSVLVRGHAIGQHVSLLVYGSLTTSVTLGIERGTVDIEAGGSLSVAALTTLDAFGSLIVTGAASLAGGISGAAGATVTVAGGTLTVASATTDSSTYTLSGSGTLDFRTTLSGTDTIAFADGTASTLRLDGAALAYGAAITGFGAGNTIDLTALGFNGGFGYGYAGGAMTLTNTGNPLETFVFSSMSDAGALKIIADGTGGTLIELACFAAGTRLRTERGDIAVEELAVGEKVCVQSPSGATETARVAWIGSRQIDVGGHPRPELVAPVRVMRDAIAPGVPERDVRLSPDHAVLLDGLLIPVRMLVNGATIAPDHRVRRVRYFHVELDRHAVLLADGLPAESYLDTGNRRQFAESGAVVALRPAFGAGATAAAYAERGCAPLATDAARVRPIWERLAARAGALGHTLAAAAASERPRVCLIVNGRTIRPLVEGGARLLFALPAGTRSVQLVSRATSPAATAAYLDDRRVLGVSVERLMVSGEAGRAAIPLDHPGLDAGWHAMERDGARAWRWTDGSAVLSHPALAGASLLAVELTRAIGAEQRRAA